MAYFPAFLKVSERPCLVVGGGVMACKKAEHLVRAGADIEVWADNIGSEMGEALGGYVAAGRVRYLSTCPSPESIAHYVIVVAATGDAAQDIKIANIAKAQNVPVNVVDRTDLCTAIMPAIVRRGDVVVAVSTGGASPVLARRIRAEIEKLLPGRLANLAAFASSFRKAVKAKLPWERRRVFWQEVLDGPIGADVLAGNDKAARDAMLTLVNKGGAEAISDSAVLGRVSIVGAGPGDPDLLTLRALHALQDADVILYDKLVGPEILSYGRADAKHIAVGKSRADHLKTQDEINQLMLSHAQKGAHVVRLKGGDPFVFGRGGEEAEFLRAHGMAVQVVPGITAATGCAATSGIALTHRDYAKAVTFVTGHERTSGVEGDAPAVNWAALAQMQHTVVIYMGLGRAQDIATRLMEHGASAQTPVAVVENGTLPSQRIERSTLDGLGALVRDAAIKGPALLIVGEVAALRNGAALSPVLDDPILDDARRIA